MARASVARSPAFMPRARSEGLRVRAAIGSLLPVLGRALRLLSVVRQPDDQPAFVFMARCSGAREREQLLARLDAAARPAGMFAILRAGRLVGIRLVDRD